jgi:hypothetical protein
VVPCQKTGVAVTPRVRGARRAPGWACPSDRRAQRPRSPRPGDTATQAPPPAPSDAQQLTDWYTGGGQDEMTAVMNDLAQISTDAGAYDMAALADDGQQLADDAETALADPPPPGPAKWAYMAGMRNYRRAGNLLAMGALQDATSYLNQGTAHITDATDEITQLTV